MKNIKRTLILLFIGISLLGYAQQFQLTDSDGVPYSEGQTISAIITELDLDEMDEFAAEVLVKNLTDTDLEVRTSRTNLVLVEDMYAYVCFGECGLPDKTEMDWSISANKSLAYSLHLHPNGKLGFCRFQIAFWSAEDQSDKQTLFLEIEMRNIGVKEQNNAAVSLSAYPNPAPANSAVNVSYTLADNNNNHRLVIRNIMGAVVMSMPLSTHENTIVFDASDLKSGVYFYTLESNNQVAVAKKLIIK